MNSKIKCLNLFLLMDFVRACEVIMSEQEKQIAIEDTISVLTGKPTINERLDILEDLMRQILSRLPYATTGYAQTAPYITTTTSSSAPATITWTTNTFTK